MMPFSTSKCVISGDRTLEAPLHVYEVLGIGPLRTKLQVAARRGLTRFVGRGSEIDQLQRALGGVKS